MDHNRPEQDRQQTDQQPFQQPVPTTFPFVMPPKKHSAGLNIFGVVIGGLSAFITIVLLIAYGSPRNPNDPWSGITDIFLIFIIPGAIFSALLLSICLPNLLLMDRPKPVTPKAGRRVRILTPVILIAVFALLFVFSKYTQNNWHDEVYAYQGAEYTYYQKTGEDRVVLTGVADGSDVPERLELPSEIEGKKVYKIADGAFKDQTDVKEVVLPEKLLVLSKYAFSGCTSLEKVTLPNELESIGDYAFGDCGSLRQINEPGMHKNFFGVSVRCSVSSNAFRGCTAAPEWTREYQEE